MENFNHITSVAFFTSDMDSKEQIYKELKANPNYVHVVGNRVDGEGEMFRSRFRFNKTKVDVNDTKTYKKYINEEDQFIAEAVYSVEGTTLIKTMADDQVEIFDFTPVIKNLEEGTERSY